MNAPIDCWIIALALVTLFYLGFHGLAAWWSL